MPRAEFVPPADTRAVTPQRGVPTIQKWFTALAVLRFFFLSSTMEIPHRKSLPHEVPLWVDPQKEIYFISINCKQRFINQLTLPNVAEKLFETVRHRQDLFLWWPYLFLLMPDHLHFGVLSALWKII